MKSADPLLDSEEIDFIQSLNFSNVYHNVEYKSDVTDNKSQGKFYGTWAFVLSIYLAWVKRALSECSCQV